MLRKKVIKYGFQRIYYEEFDKNSTETGHNLLRDGHVLSATETIINDESVIEVKVARKTTISDVRLVKIKVDKQRNVVEKSCQCPAGAAGTCSHTAAAIFYINYHDGNSQTSEGQQWMAPPSYKTQAKLREKYSKATKIKNLVKTPKHKQENAPVEPYVLTLERLSSIPCTLRMLLDTKECTNFDEVKIKQDVELCMKSILDQIVKIEKYEDLVSLLLEKQQSSLLIDKSKFQLQFNEHEAAFSQNTDVDDKKFADIFVNSIDQSNTQSWFNERKYRISASLKAHRIKTRKRDFESLLNTDYLKEQKQLSLKSFEYGKKMESVAFKAFGKSLNDEYSMENSGLIVSMKQPWLCCSPDGIILLSGQIFGTLEIKCPISCAGEKLLEDGRVNTKISKYVELSGNQPVVKKNHIYYTQVQMQMYITGVENSYFFVYTNKDQLIIEIKIDYPFLRELIPKLNTFYITYLLPAIPK